MKRILSFILATILCLSLCACDMTRQLEQLMFGNPLNQINDLFDQPDPQPETVATQPSTIAATEAPTLPPTEPTTEPAPTEPVITTCKFLQKVKKEYFYVFKEPDHTAKISQILPKGTFTIVKETYDADGHHWGKLKSGVGWICLTEVQENRAPVQITAATNSFLKSGTYTKHGNVSGQYTIPVRLHGLEKLTSIAVYNVDFDSGKKTGSAIVKKETLKEGNSMVIWLDFPMDFNTYEIHFTNASGTKYKYQIAENLSGEGELIGSWLIK